MGVGDRGADIRCRTLTFRSRDVAVSDAGEVILPPPPSPLLLLTVLLPTPPTMSRRASMLSLLHRSSSDKSWSVYWHPTTRRSLGLPVARASHLPRSTHASRTLRTSRALAPTACNNLSYYCRSTAEHILNVPGARYTAARDRRTLEQGRARHTWGGTLRPNSQRRRRRRVQGKAHVGGYTTGKQSEEEEEEEEAGAGCDGAEQGPRP